MVKNLDLAAKMLADFQLGDVDCCRITFYYWHGRDYVGASPEFFMKNGKKYKNHTERQWKKWLEKNVEGSIRAICIYYRFEPIPFGDSFHIEASDLNKAPVFDRIIFHNPLREVMLKKKESASIHGTDDVGALYDKLKKSRRRKRIASDRAKILPPLRDDIDCGDILCDTAVNW